MIGRRRAVATVFSTVMMISITLAMGTIYLAWASGLLGSFTSGAQVQYLLLEERKEEAIVIENVWLQGGTTIKVFMRNIGTREANIVAAYVNGTTYSTLPALPQTLLVSENLTLTIQISHNARYPQLIVVATARGNQARGEWTG